MSNKYDGRELVVMTGNTAQTMVRVAGSRNCAVTVNGEMRELVQQNGNTRLKAGRYGWQITANGLYTVGNSADLFRAALSRTVLHVGAVVGAETWTGRGFVTQLEVSGRVKGKVEYNLTIQGSGELDTGGEE